VARKITWTETAWIDLEEVADYIGKDSPHYAGAFVREFSAQCGQVVGRIFKNQKLIYLIPSYLLL